MDTERLKIIASRLLLVVIVCGFLVSAIIYLNSRWEKIRDIRRLADASSIVKALDYYNLQFGAYPDNTDDDGQGWDKTNDPANRKFLEPLMKVGLLPNLVFDPKNDNTYYYRYQKFSAGDYGCEQPFVIFQVASFEEKEPTGSGRCPQINWATLAPKGYTWQGQN